MQHELLTSYFTPDTCFGALPVRNREPALFRRNGSFFVKTAERTATCVRSGEESDNYLDTYEFGDSVPVQTVTLEECGCCGSYHPERYVGECRDDTFSFPTWQVSELMEELAEELANKVK